MQLPASVSLVWLCLSFAVGSAAATELHIHAHRRSPGSLVLTVQQTETLAKSRHTSASACLAVGSVFPLAGSALFSSDCVPDDPAMARLKQHHALANYTMDMAWSGSALHGNTMSLLSGGQGNWNAPVWFETRPNASALGPVDPLLSFPGAEAGSIKIIEATFRYEHGILEQFQVLQIRLPINYEPEPIEAEVQPGVSSLKIFDERTASWLDVDPETNHRRLVLAIPDQRRTGSPDILVHLDTTVAFHPNLAFNITRPIEPGRQTSWHILVALDRSLFLDQYQLESVKFPSNIRVKVFGRPDLEAPAYSSAALPNMGQITIPPTASQSQLAFSIPLHQRYQRPSDTQRYFEVGLPTILAFQEMPGAEYRGSFMGLLPHGGFIPFPVSVQTSDGPIRMPIGVEHDRLWTGPVTLLLAWAGAVAVVVGIEHALARPST